MGSLALSYVRGAADRVSGETNERINKQTMPRTKRNGLRVSRSLRPWKEMFHDEVTGMNYSYQELVQTVVQILEMHG